MGNTLETYSKDTWRKPVGSQSCNGKPRDMSAVKDEVCYKMEETLNDPNKFNQTQNIVQEILFDIFTKKKLRNQKI